MTTPVDKFGLDTTRSVALGETLKRLGLPVPNDASQLRAACNSALENVTSPIREEICDADPTQRQAKLVQMITLQIRTAFDAVKSQINDVKKDTEKVQAEVKRKTDELNQVVASAEALFYGQEEETKMLRGAKTQLDAITLERDKLQLSLGEALSRLASQSDDLRRDFDLQIQTQRNQAAAALQEQVDAYNERKADLDRASDRLKEANLTYAELEAKHKDTESKLAQANEQLKKRGDELNDLKRRNNELNAQLAAKQRQIDDQITQLQQAKSMMSTFVIKTFQDDQVRAKLESDINSLQILISDRQSQALKDLNNMPAWNFE